MRSDALITSIGAASLTRGAGVEPCSADLVTQQAYLKASNTGASDAFGYAVAVSGDTLVIGAPDEDSRATGVNGEQSNNDAPPISRRRTCLSATATAGGASRPRVGPSVRSAPRFRTQFTLGGGQAPRSARSAARRAWASSDCSRRARISVRTTTAGSSSTRCLS